MNTEKQLRGFILTRFFIIFIITSIFEFVVVILTNSFVVPALIKAFGLDVLLNIGSAENLFLIAFVLIVSSLINSVLPFFKISPDAINAFLNSLLAERGSDVVTATDTIREVTHDPKSVGLLILAIVVTAIVLITPYIVGGVLFSVSIAREIRLIEREKEEARRKEEKRRYLMISNIVHDLKTPMTTVYGYAKALNDGIVPAEKQTEYHEAIMAKTNRMNEVVALLLDYVKLDSEGFTIKKTNVDMCELVRSCCAFSFTDIESAGDEIDVDIPERSIFVDADNLQFTRVINNLITNAIRHNPSGIKIKVAVRSESEMSAEDVRIFVADSGDEIPADIKEHIFEPFFTGDESRSTGGGTGLGLPLSSRICDMHGFKLKLVQNPEILRYHLGDEYKKVFVISI
jgi:signal transduction histidine kinase